MKPHPLLLLTLPSLTLPSPLQLQLQNHHITLSSPPSPPTLLLNSTPWHALGPNIYWLGLDENIIPPGHSSPALSYPYPHRTTEAMLLAKALGSTTIRSHTLGISTGNPLSLIPNSTFVINEDAFHPIDWAVYQARQHGLRLLIPLTDNFDYYHGGKYDFLRWNGYNLTREKDGNSPAVMASVVRWGWG